MSMNLVSEHFPIEKRANAIGWISAGTALTGIFGGPYVGFLSGVGGWRLAFVGLGLPVSLAGLALAAKYLPSKPPNQSSGKGGGALGGFSSVLSNRSAVFCLVGYALTMSAISALDFYGFSFFRQRFLLSAASASVMQSGVNLGYTSGSLLSGRLVNRFGGKAVLISTVMGASFFIASYSYMEAFWLSLTVFFFAYMFTGTLIPAYYSLALEQVQGSRGIILTMSTAAANIGMSLGAGLGGLMLILFDYGYVGIALGLSGIAATAIFRFLTVEPL
jgi:predicted MFS family arabinose efflux permease